MIGIRGPRRWRVSGVAVLIWNHRRDLLHITLRLWCLEGEHLHISLKLRPHVAIGRSREATGANRHPFDLVGKNQRGRFLDTLDPFHRVTAHV